MLKTYKAKIKKNIIKWLDDKPENHSKNDTFLVYVTIIDKENQRKKTTDNLIDFFKNSPLYDSGIEFERSDDYGREVIV